MTPLLWLGLGCRAGTAVGPLFETVRCFLAAHSLTPAALTGLASLDRRTAEPGLIALAAELALPLHGFSAARLEQETPRLATPSARVFALTGCHGVAEAAALAAAGPNACLRVPRVRTGDITLALAETPLS